jgi:UDP-N-acetylmuramyl pentapeptide phosphotransferase/UDP-N-acetylglucosamine-1-phosphate transferase
MTFAAGWAILAAVSLRDDLHGVSIFYRLVVQTIAAIMMTTTWVTIEPSFQKLSFNILDLFFVPRELAVISVVVFIVWMVNLFNFMDGSDGLATTMAVIGFTTLSIAAHWMSFAWWWLPALVAGACLPVYFVNFPPARMFIGDVGAVPLGFLVAGFGGLGIVQHGWPVGFLVLVFLPFILDATVTLSWRVLRGERFWEAHKTHYFQRLVQMGLGHRGVLAVYTTLMIGCSVTALWTYHYHKGLYVALGFWIVVHAVLFLVVDVKTVRESSNS